MLKLGKLLFVPYSAGVLGENTWAFTLMNDGAKMRTPMSLGSPSGCWAGLPDGRVNEAPASNSSRLLAGKVHVAWELLMLS